MEEKIIENINKRKLTKNKKIVLITIIILIIGTLLSILGYKMYDRYITRPKYVTLMAQTEAQLSLQFSNISSELGYSMDQSDEKLAARTKCKNAIVSLCDEMKANTPEDLQDYLSKVKEDGSKEGLENVQAVATSLQTFIEKSSDRFKKYDIEQDELKEKVKNILLEKGF